VAPETSTAGAAARPDPEVLFAGAEECAVTGDAGGAARLYAQAAEAYLAMGAADTAVDACLRALAGAPGDTGVHLALARVHLASGHADRADKKLRLLRRLRELDDDAEATARVDRFRETHLPMG
jgi:Tfp pilus assembly protein PilF